jgi:hypothetical protein
VDLKLFKRDEGLIFVTDDIDDVDVENKDDNWDQFNYELDVKKPKLDT